MSETADWGHLIERKLTAAAEQRRSAREHVQQRMDEAERRWQEFGPLADRIADTIIRPRLVKLAGYFDNASVLPDDQARRFHCACVFGETEWVPATARVEVGVITDGLADRLVVQCLVAITPRLVPYHDRSELILPFDRVDETRLAGWVEEQLVAFVDTYLRLEELEPYQRDNLVTDPVCGMRIHKALAAGREEYGGTPYHFCTEQCRQAFAEDPARYVPPV